MIDFKKNYYSLEDDSEKASFILKKSKENCNEIISNQSFLISLLSDEAWVVRENVLFALLSKCDVLNDDLLLKVRRIALDSSEYINVRVAALSGVGSVFQGTKNVEFLRLVMMIYCNGDEAAYLRNIALKSGLEIYGLKYIDIFRRVKRSVSNEVEFELNIKEFDFEIEAIKDIVGSRDW